MSGPVAEILDELCGSWEQAARGPIAFKGLRGRRTYEQQVAIVLGLASHVMETARLLHGIGAGGKLSVTSMPLVRSALESAVTGIWIAQVEDAADAFIHRHSRQEELLLEQFRSSGDPTWTRLVEAMEPHSYNLTPTSSHHQAKSFESLCNDLEFGSTIYALYRTLSGWSHASVRIADEYIVDASKLGAEGKAPFAVLTTAAPFEGQDTWLFITAMSALWASRSVNFITQDKTQRGLLQSAARRLGVPLNLNPSQAPFKRRALRKFR